MTVDGLPLAVTPGEPAGIGPDIALQVALRANPFMADSLPVDSTPADPGQAAPEYRHPTDLVLIADRDLLAARALALGLDARLVAPGEVEAPGDIAVEHVPAATSARAGTLDPRNAGYVLATLDAAVAGIRDGRYGALVTGPVHKGVINDAGVPFSGHTEYLAEATGGYPVMMLVAPVLRVALVTTHLALADVPAALSAGLVEKVIRILDADLRNRFGIADPRILVCGVNPHAGEDGHIGREEVDWLTACLRTLAVEGLGVVGPCPADTAFVPAERANADVVLAMYHDQGLPVLKALGFGDAVNVTLGLPIIRTSVDHGTALPIAGTGKARPESLQAAVALAAGLVADG